MNQKLVLNPNLRHLLLGFLLLIVWSSTAEKSLAQRFTLSGYVKEAATGEVLVGANVYVKELLKGTTTNNYGFYSMTLPEGNYTVVISYIGFTDTSRVLELNKDIRYNMDLKSKAVLTQEVEITGERADKNTEDAQMGVVELEMKQIKELPAFLGEVDLLKTIQLLPGVQSAGEGNAGFYVRGGGPDQNLILLDEGVIYNASHLFGFFSVFNSDAVKNIELTKGGMPAQYGGRLASVLDVSMKEGNNKNYEATGGIGLISSRLTLEGPIKKDTASFMISGRRTYIDVLAAPFIPDSSAFSGSGYFFYDLNGKANWTISDKDRLFLSGYLGRDIFTFSNNEDDFKVRVPWGNSTLALRWNHLFSDKLFANTTFIYSDYEFAFEATQSDFDFKLFSGIEDWNGKVDFNYFPSIRHDVKFGLHYTFHTFTPSSVTARQGETTFDTGEILKQYAHEAALYINDEFDLTENLRINAGVRYSGFRQIGPFSRIVKAEIGTSIDTIDYGRGENVATYTGLEPRLTVRYRLNSRSSLKAAYTLNYQYIHLASLSGVSLPTDVWVSSSDKVKPQRGVQYAVGYFQN
ncbi:MAG: TonB-dependent receptor domain-containing protein, partial [Salibacteraceae bacterium]